MSKRERGISEVAIADRLQFVIGEKTRPVERPCIADQL